MGIYCEPVYARRGALDYNAAALMAKRVAARTRIADVIKPKSTWCVQDVLLDRFHAFVCIELLPVHGVTLLRYAAKSSLVSSLGSTN